MSVLDGAVVRPFGLSALVLEYGDRIDPSLHERVLAADRGVVAAALPGVEEVVPSYRSLLLRLDPLVVTPEQVVTALADVPAQPRDREPRVVTVPLDPAGGDDLPEVAARTGLADAAAVLALLTGADLRVYLHGFAPGFTYLGGVPATLHLPRRATPRSPVAPGSVLLAAGQAALCPTSMPTGWWVVGRTSMALFDAAADPPVPLAPGDLVRLRVGP